MPPGPPPGMPPRIGIRMPPGPPPGMPNHRLHHPHQQHHNSHNKPQPPHLSVQAAPQLLTKDTTKGMTTITAKPQIRYNLLIQYILFILLIFFLSISPERNLSADVTRFVPTALRNKREEKSKSHPMQPHQLRQPPSRPFISGPHHPNVHNAPGHDHPTPKPATKDDAYMQFMREMKGLL